mmetsp:Transcript_96526/g.278617  ORF Transcript_96526/g.278617 Transcript_96526/m.278617 type:complete len:221 (+) Transcript_96526:285-947(+)
MFCSNNVREDGVPGLGAGGEEASAEFAGAGAAPEAGGACRPTTVGTPCSECAFNNFRMRSMRLASGSPPVPVAPKSLSFLRSMSSGGGADGAAGAGAGGATDWSVIWSSWPTSWKPCIEDMASWASLCSWKVIQHSSTPISNFSNSPKGLKMPRMSSSVTTARRFLMCNFRVFGPARSPPTPPVLMPVSTCCVNCCRVIVLFGCGMLLTNCASARFTNTN